MPGGMRVTGKINAQGRGKRLALGGHLSVGVELRSWVTTPHAESMLPIIADVRRVFPGLLTYSANWDDVDQTVILGDLDVIGINAFYPLASQNGAPESDLFAGAEKVRRKVHDLAETWQRPVVFTEIGYTTRPDPAVPGGTDQCPVSST